MSNPNSKKILICLVVSIFTSCQASQQESITQHFERDLTSPGPSYLWQATQDLPGAHSDIPLDNFGEPENSPIVLRLQGIANHLDSIARNLNPIQMSKIPKPNIAVLRIEDYNAISISDMLCLIQIADQKTLDMSKIEEFTKVKKVFDFSSLGVELDGYSKDKCPITLNVEDLDAGFFVDNYNSRLPFEKSQCKLSIQDSRIIVPTQSACTIGSGDSVDYGLEVIKFSVQTNLIIFYKGFLEKNSESSVIMTMAHELAHYYKRHSGFLGQFEPYFFLQTEENELQRPLKTTKHLDIQQALLDRSMLNEIPPPSIQGGRFTPYLFTTMLDTALNLSRICAQNPKIFLDCAEQKFFDLYHENLETIDTFSSKFPSEEAIKVYHQFENAFEAILASIDPQLLDEEQKKSITSPANLLLPAKYFGNINETKSLLEWFENANLRIVNDLKMLDDALTQAASLGLGYYTYEEEADEVAIELLAQAGFTKQQMIDAWIVQMRYQDAMFAAEETPNVVSLKDCLELRQSNWRLKNLDVMHNFLLGRLKNIHHSNCYRLYNSEREWNAHNMDKLLPESGIVLDEKAWKVAINSSF